MPIYSYRCVSCGNKQDVLRKISDAPLEVCPACGAATFRKQVTAAGFQLKGSGWYVSDFRDPPAKPGASKMEPATGAAADVGAKKDGSGEGKYDPAESGKGAAPDSASSPAAADKVSGSTTGPARAPTASGPAAATGAK